MDIGSKLQKRRTEFKLTQNQVVDELGVSRQTISNWENNRSYPDIERIIHLSEIYELSLDELFKGDFKIVHQLQKNTKENRYFKFFAILLLINIFLMILLI